MSDNELIAEFMGQAIVYEYPREYSTKKRVKVKLNYNTSWKWLMPVVEKINEPEVKKGKIIRSTADVTIYYKACEIEYTPDEDFEDRDHKIIRTQGATKIEAVYKAVVEFIKWYNTKT